MDRHVDRGQSAEKKSRPSLIERAATRLEDAAVNGTGPEPSRPPPAGQQPPPPTGQEAPSPRQEPPRRESPRRQEAPRRPYARKAPLEIDFEGLRHLGYLTPETMQSHLAEEMRLIKRTVLHRFREQAAPRSNMIMVSSAEPGAGKSFVALNLAMSLAAEVDLHALLIDGDCWQPEILKRLGVSTDTGLLDALADPDMDVGEIIHRTNVERLSVIGAGQRRQLTSELLSSERMRRVADELAQRYPDRLIIFDTSPLLAAAESAVVGELVGQTLIVVEADRTDRSSLDQALDLLPESPEPSLVLNKGKARAGANQLYYHRYYK